MLKVKLSQRGKKNQLTYRIIVAEARSKRDGKFIDDLGWWDPGKNSLKIDKKKFASWQKKGAQPTAATKKLMAKRGKIN